jgi:hypothetical protein
MQLKAALPSVSQHKSSGAQKFQPSAAITKHVDAGVLFVLKVCVEMQVWFSLLSAAIAADVCAPLARLFSVLAAAQIKTRARGASFHITSHSTHGPPSQSGSDDFEGHVPSILTDGRVYKIFWPLSYIQMHAMFEFHQCD